MDRFISTGRDPIDQLNVCLFGRLNVESAGRTLGSRDFGGIKPRQILEILLLSRGHAVPKDRLADLLWGELLPQNVTGALETYVSVLRRHLCPEGRIGHAVIVTEPEAYRLAADMVDVDLDRFDALRAEAANANGNSPRAQLEAAIELAHGDVLEDEPYAEWVLPVRELYQERRLQALADAGVAALAEGDYEAALAHSAAAIQLDSVNEPAYRTMMLAYNALDRPQDALRAFERCRRELERVLDATPSRATERLHEGIRRHEDHAQLLVDKPPTAAWVTHTPQNGGSRDLLIGRVDELAALRQALASARAGAFTLAFVEGEPGIGKTRLLHEALTPVADGTRVGLVRCTEFERTVPYAALAYALREVLGGFELDPSLSEALGGILPELSLDRVPTADDPRALEALVSVVRSLGPLVLVLDDLHHADPSTVTAVGYLARRCADAPVAILAGVGGELPGPDDRLYALEPTLRLQLEPLSRRELTAAGLGPLYEQSYGHPLIVSALMANDGTLPQKTAEVLLERCRAQGLFAFRLLAAASVLSQPFSPEVLAMVVDAAEARVVEALERLCERGLLQVQGLCFAFKFQIVADVLQKNLTPFARTLLADRVKSVGADALGEPILRVEAS